MVLQSNPTVFVLNPETQAAPQLPASMGPTYLSGAIEFPPVGLALEWAEMSEADYITLATNYHLVPCTMIDMEDNGYFGWLRLGAFEFLVGAAQKVGKVTAVFMTSTPAPGLVSTINNIFNPIAPTTSVGTGGSLNAGSTLYYAMTFWTRWGETGISPVATVSTGGTSNAAVTLSWTAPTTLQYRRARIYTASSAAGLAAGQTATILADVWAAFTQSYIDTCNMNGNSNSAIIPSSNTAYLGQFLGARWVSGS